MKIEGRIDVQAQPEVVQFTRATNSKKHRRLMLKVGRWSDGVEVSIEVPDANLLLKEVTEVLEWLKENE